MALHEVKQRGAQEALILGPSGEVIEGATSNVFVVRAGELITPPIDAGILAGITRQTVLEVAAEQAMPVHETQLHPSDLYGADEVFITSTVREVVPVVRVDDKTIGDGKPGPISARVLAGYRAKTRY
jgi:branched-chain amino acid aminotransferase